MFPLNAVALLCCVSFFPSDAFTSYQSGRLGQGHNIVSLRVSSAREAGSAEVDLVGLHLTPELEKMTTAFAMLSDEKTRYRQLLFLATKLAPIDESARTSENKVPGCLSTVYVDCTAETTEDGETIINFVGDSDGQLTKGLVALLVRGLSGNTAEEINSVDPEFIKVAKISQSLTPGRNNGFLNMVAVMKRKALDADANFARRGEDETVEEPTSCENKNTITTFEAVKGKPMYNAIMAKLIDVLSPAQIELVDESHQHAGHAGSKGYEESGESHFSLFVVAEAFEELSLVKRHQLIYLILGDIMPKIHALRISAKTPKEA